MSIKQLPKRRLGSQGLEVPVIGLGCMGMTSAYLLDNYDYEQEEENSLNTIATAVEYGLNFLDTAWVYQSFGKGDGKNHINEELVGKAIKRHGRENLIIATKFGLGFSAEGISFNSKPEFIRAQLQESLTRLGTDYIDLYYQHRVDPNTPIELTVQTLKELVHEGKIKYIGLSEVTPDELERAHAIHPITAVQMEWSLNSRDIEDSIVPKARALGVGIVAYSPLGRGLLTGAITSADSLESGDWRKTLPRFNDANIADNVASVADLFTLAKLKGCTPAQLALAWVIARGEDVVPIPGTKSKVRLLENIEAAFINLSHQELAEIEVAVKPIVGDRYGFKIGTFNERL
eukprot:gene17585-23155_t